MSRKILILLFFSSVLILVLALFPYENLVQGRIISWMNSKGYGPVQLEVKSIGKNGIELQNFNGLKNTVSFKTLEIKWNLVGLLGKQIDDIQVSGLEIDYQKLIKEAEKNSSGNDVSGPSSWNQIWDSIPFDKGEVQFKLPLHPVEKVAVKQGSLLIGFDKVKRELTLRSVDEISLRAGGTSINEVQLDVQANLLDEKIVFTSHKMQMEILHDFGNEEKRKLKLYGLSLVKGGRMEFLETKTGIGPGKMNLQLFQRNGSLGEKEVEWGKVELKLEGDFEELKATGKVNGINHVKSNCLAGLDLTYQMKKLRENFHIEVQSSEKRKGMKLEIEGEMGKEVDLKILFSDLSKVETRKHFPCMGKDIEHLAGKLSLKGTIPFNQKRQPILKLELDDVGLKWDDMILKGLNLKHELNNFQHFSSQNWSHFHLDKLGVGMDLMDSNIEFKILNKNKISIRKMNFKVLDGLFSMTPFLLFPNSGGFSDLSVNIRDLSLEQVLKVGLKDAVAAEGKLAGQLPIKFRSGHFLIEKGYLETTARGRLKYRPSTFNPLKQTGQSQTGLLSDYLHDFYYDKLYIDVSSNEQYNLLLNSRLIGRNPAVNDGRPLKFALNLDFNIKDTIKSTLYLLSFPKKIEKGILEKLKL